MSKATTTSSKRLSLKGKKLKAPDVLVVEGFYPLCLVRPDFAGQWTSAPEGALVLHQDGKTFKVGQFGEVVELSYYENRSAAYDRLVCRKTWAEMVDSIPEPLKEE